MRSVFRNDAQVSRAGLREAIKEISVDYALAGWVAA